MSLCAEIRTSQGSLVKRASTLPPPRPPRSARSLCVTRASSPRPPTPRNKRLSSDSSSQNSSSGSSNTSSAASSQTTLIQQCDEQPTQSSKALCFDSAPQTVPAAEVLRIYASLHDLMADLCRDLNFCPEPLPRLNYGRVAGESYGQLKHSHIDTAISPACARSRRSSTSSYSSTSSFVLTPSSSTPAFFAGDLEHGTQATSLAPSSASKSMCGDDAIDRTMEFARLQDTIGDLSDENAMLRAQLTLVSEQLVLSSSRVSTHSLPSSL